MNWNIHNLREIVKSVSAASMPREINVWRDTLGWTERHTGTLSREQLQFWHLNADVNGSEMLCGFPGADYGLLRLVQFENCEQTTIRAGAQIWETGGIFDFDLRIAAMQTTYNALVDAGWYVFGEPIELRIGDFVLNEALLFGPEAAGLALVERIQPPISKANAHNGILGTIYLSVTVAKNIATTAHFLTETLGFTELERLLLINNNPAPTMFRLPWNLSTQVPVQLAGFSPTGSRETIIEVLQFEGLYGEDRSERAVPPNRGLLMYRFPVHGIDAYVAHVSARTAITTPLTMLQMPPYGLVKAFAVRSPDGVWFEFFEETLVGKQQ
jgi:catechol 2,3-dioxygenase-like lactoylglutathione lyase family enzyme